MDIICSWSEAAQINKLSLSTNSAQFYGWFYGPQMRYLSLTELAWRINCWFIKLLLMMINTFYSILCLSVKRMKTTMIENLDHRTFHSAISIMIEIRCIHWCVLCYPSLRNNLPCFNKKMIITIFTITMMEVVKVSGANPIRSIMPPRTHSLSRPRDQPSKFLPCKLK